MNFRDVLLVLHIAGVGVWLGANVMQAVMPPIAARAGSETLAWWYRATSGLSKTLYMPAAILILLSGILLVLQSDAYGFGTVFVTIGFAVIVIGAVLGITVFAPGGEAAAAAAEADDASALRTAAGRIARFGILDSLLILFTITAMVLRLGT